MELLIYLNFSLIIKTSSDVEKMKDETGSISPRFINC